MRLFVYGNNKDDKGTQLEVLTAAILKGMGYVVVRNEVKSGGNELGIRGTGTFMHSLYTNKHNIFPQELLSKCSLN